jgi:hypothetical protein
MKQKIRIRLLKPSEKREDHDDQQINQCKPMFVSFTNKATPDAKEEVNIGEDIRQCNIE